MELNFVGIGQYMVLWLNIADFDGIGQHMIFWLN